MGAGLAQSSPHSGTKRAGRQANDCHDHAWHPCRSLAGLRGQSEQKRFEKSLCRSLDFSATDISGLLRLEEPRVLFPSKGQICLVRPGGLEGAVGGVKHWGVFNLCGEFLEQDSGQK